MRVHKERVKQAEPGSDERHSGLDRTQPQIRPLSGDSAIE